MNSIKASDLIADFLASKNIQTVFGIVGSGNAHIFDSITRKQYTEIVCVHHEQAAVMAMGTFFRTSGKLAAALVTTGGGAANAFTGVISCWMDSVPGMIIAGNENSRFTHSSNPLRGWGIQGFDSVRMVEKITKYASRVMDPTQLSYELEKAHQASLSDRAGPVWIEVPMNIQSAMVDLRTQHARDTEKATRSATAKSMNKDKKSGSSEILGETLDQLDQKVHQSAELQAQLSKFLPQIAEKLRQAERPVLWLGHGIRLSNALEEMNALITAIQAPVLLSWAGADLLATNHPLNFGRAGIYGLRASNFVLQNCDFLLNIGNRMAIPQIGYELSELCRAAKICVVDIDPLETGKLGEKVDYPVHADAKEFIVALLAELVQENSKQPVPSQQSELTHSKSKQSKLDSSAQQHSRYAPWLRQCEQYRKRYPSIGPEHADLEHYPNSYPFIQKLSKHLRPDEVIVTDMGTALLSGHQVLELREQQRLMTSTGLGEMGYGLPAAIGASFARSRGEVICLNCDGGMMMNLQELQTIAHHRLPIKIFIFNNDGYLMIKHTQKSLFQGYYSGTDKASGVSCPDFSKLAAVFGFKSFAIRSWSDFDQEIPKVFGLKEPLIIEVFMHPEQRFLPKLGLSPQPDGSIVSPPLEDLMPFLPREELRENMIIGIHEKSEKIKLE